MAFDPGYAFMRMDISSCSCGWTGIPTLTGGTLTKPKGPLVRHPLEPRERYEQRAGKRAGSRPSCPRCRRSLEDS